MEQKTTMGLCDFVMARTKEIHDESDLLIRRSAKKLSQREVYCSLLCDLHCIFAKMEECWQLHRTVPQLEEAFDQRILRKKALEDDLDFHYGHAWRTELRPTVLANAYALRMQQVTFSDPILLLSHIYLLYFSLLAGGQLIQRWLIKHMNLPQDKGHTLYSFATNPDGTRDKTFYLSYRARLNNLSISEQSLDNLALEGRRIFVDTNAIIRLHAANGKLLSQSIIPSSSTSPLMSAAGQKPFTIRIPIIIAIFMMGFMCFSMVYITSRPAIPTII